MTQRRIVAKPLVSSRVYTQFWTAHTPLYGSKVIYKSVATQCKSWLGITPIPRFHPYLAGNTLRVYTQGYSIFNDLDSGYQTFIRTTAYELPVA